MKKFYKLQHTKTKRFFIMHNTIKIRRKWQAEKMFKSKFMHFELISMKKSIIIFDKKATNS
jgi:hypothetical protein